MKLSAIWVYPVKSMAGIALSRCDATPAGLPLDRNCTVRDCETGKVLTAIKHPELLRLEPFFLGAADEVRTPSFRAASVSERPGNLAIRFPDGETLSAADDRINLRLGELLGRPVQLEFQDHGVFDGAAIHLLTVVSLEHLGRRVGESVDAQNFRANLRIEVERQDGGFAESDWVGGRLKIGSEVMLGLDRGCPRCVMSTTDPSTLARNPKILEVLKAENQGCFGIYASVVRGGSLEVGDEVNFENRLAV